MFINNPHLTNTEVKSLYDKHMIRQYGVQLPLRIFDTGSKGNSVYFTEQRLLIDLGLPKSDYPSDFFYDVHSIVITHHHGDHVNPSTLCYVLENHPHITIYMSQSCFEELTDETYRAKYKYQTDRDGNRMYEQKRQGLRFVDNKQKPLYALDDDGEKIIERSPYKERIEKHSKQINTERHQLNITLPDHNNYTLTFRQVKHGDILNRAIELHDKRLDLRALYVSDVDNLKEGGYFTDYKGRTYNLDGVSQEKDRYNLVLVEANYNEDKMQEYLSGLQPDDPNYHNKQYRAHQNLRHLSEREAQNYISITLKEDGYFIPLHASEKFGTLFQ